MVSSAPVMASRSKPSMSSFIKSTFGSSRSATILIDRLYWNSYADSPQGNGRSQNVTMRTGFVEFQLSRRRADRERNNLGSFQAIASEICLQSNAVAGRSLYGDTFPSGR